MEKTLLERLGESREYIEEYIRPEDAELLDALREKGIELPEDLDNDPFYVSLQVFRADNSGECCWYAYCVDAPYVKAIHRDLEQSDGRTYIVTFELSNGYDVSFGIDTGDEERIFVHGGKDVTSAYPFAWISEFRVFDDLLEEISKLPSDAHLWTEFKGMMLLEGMTQAEAVEEYMNMYGFETEKELYEYVEAEEENAKKRYS